MNHLHDATTQLANNLWPTRYGVMTAANPESFAAQSLKAYGEWMEQEIELLSTVIEEGHTVLEFGAETGAHTLWLAKAVGERGQVHVTEPRRLTFQKLCANVALNQLSNVYTYQRYLGRATGQGMITSGESKDEAFTVTTVDELKLDALHLIKVNPQKALINLLAGAAETIRKHRPIIYFRLSEIELAHAEVQAIKDLGYRAWSHVPYLYNPDNHVGSATNLFPGCVYQNVIASPAEGNFQLDARHEL
ncbi:FkbM family methyltransferase [Dyella monticola]|nr:FkbM family methyltransferase [Dyella monticola]